MKESKVIVKRVISYCDIPDELIDKCADWLNDYQNGCFVPYSLEIREDIEQNWDELDVWLMENYAELKDTEFLINMDY